VDESSVAAAIAVAVWGFLAPLAQKASAPTNDTAPDGGPIPVVEVVEDGKVAPDETDEAVRGIGDALRFVRDRYVDEVPTDELAAGAVAGLAAALDPWCERMTPKDVREMEREDAGRYTGIGVSVSEGPGKTILVDWPEPGSPAFRAGIRMDDRIVAVDGIDADAFGFDETVDRIGGEVGTTVEIAWERADRGGVATARVTRAALSVPTVQAVRRIGGDVGYLFLAEFASRTPRELRRAVRSLNPATLRGLVVDLRDDPGGDVEAAVACASLFLPRRALVARTRGRIPKEDDHNYRSAGGEAWPDLRLALLVNGETASAAEIFAGALRDHGRAPLFGGRTFGKGLVQGFFDLEGPSGASTLKLTTARWYTPSGAMVHGAGIEPDFPFAQSDEEAFALVRARMLAVWPELAEPSVRSRILAVPDRALDAALAWVRDGDPPPAARPEAPPRIPETPRSPVRK
jgi:carboxyl-terminal processing protease